jgi:hypothetical protein
MLAHQECGVFLEIYQLVLPTNLMPHHGLVHNSYIYEQFSRYIELYAIYIYTPIEITQATRERSLARSLLVSSDRADLRQLQPLQLQQHHVSPCNLKKQP